MHPFIVLESGHGGSSLSEKTSLSQPPLPVLLRRLQGVPRTQWRGPGSSLGSPPSHTCLKHLHREASRRYPYQMNHLSWLLWMWRSSSSALSLSWIFEPLTLSLRESPATVQRKLILTACICFMFYFGSYPKLVTTGEGRNVDRPVNGELFLAAQLPLQHTILSSSHMSEIVGARTEEVTLWRLLKREQLTEEK